MAITIWPLLRMLSWRMDLMVFNLLYAKARRLSNLGKRAASTTSRESNLRFTECYTFLLMFARKLKVDVIIGGERRPCPLEWLDAFAMRNFTGSAEFDDTLPTGEGRMEAGLRVEASRLAEALSTWLTKRGKGNGQPVHVEINPA
jgi:hypothetical protein